ncbi:MAG TPA: glycosyltransferase family 2 protein [Candidatus Nanoarchaeia archaeon]|nr:glycosyltransferase family 2 protein [Candidatus Nanoarchaeia archaeon]
MTPQEISLAIYNLTLLPVVFFSILFLLMAVLNIFMDRPDKNQRTKPLKHFPFVTVQVPSFNDPVAIKCIECCRKFDYPKNRYEIMILDDSTDLKTQKMLKKYAKNYPGFMKYIHRENRIGYKPGALQAAMPYVKGEIIVIFDSDFLPAKDFLKKIVAPFEDPKVAVVQSRQGFINKDVNLISRFAAYLLLVHHVMLMPVYNKLNTVFFCGTGGAIRKSVIDEVGGWKIDSITEDTDLSIRILSKGYKNVYLKLETPSEVPITLEGFITQQVRWTFGNVRAFIDNIKRIAYQGQLRVTQKAAITFMTMGNIIAPAVILMTLAGLTGWFLGEPQLFEFSQLMELIIKFAYTAGFLILATITLIKHKSMADLPKLVLAAFSISIILAFANCVAIFRAIFMKDKPLFGRKTSWLCTPKQGNYGISSR